MVLSICPFLQLVWSAAGAPSCGFQSMGWTVAPLHSNVAMRTPHPGMLIYAPIHAPILICSYPHILTSSYAHILICSYPHILISSASASQRASQPASQPAGLHWAPSALLELQKRQSRPILAAPFFFIRVRRFLMVLGRRSAKVVLKRVSSAQTRFGAPKTSKNVVHV